MKKKKIIKFVVIFFSFLFTLYVLAGFFVVPLIVKDQIIRHIQTVTGRTVSLDKVSFNPLALSVTVYDLSILGKKGKDFFSWEELHVNYQVLSLTRLTLGVDEIRLIKPEIYIERLADNKFNFSDLLYDIQKLKQRRGKNKRKKIKIIPLSITKFILDSGNLHFRDNSMKKHTYFKLASISFQLDDFSTKLNPEETNSYFFTAHDPSGGFLYWDGNFRLVPLTSKGTIELSGVDLASLFVFYKDKLNFSIPRGKLGFKTNYSLTGSPAIAIALTDCSYTITGLKLTEKKSGKTILTIPYLAANDVYLTTAKRKVSTGSIALNGGEFRINVNKNGENNITKAMDFSGIALEDDTEKASDTPGDAPDPAQDKVDSQKWTCEVFNFDLNGFKVNYVDNSAKKPLNVSLDPLNMFADKIVAGSGNKSGKNRAPMLSINSILVADSALNVQINEKQNIKLKKTRKNTPTDTPVKAAGKTQHKRPVININEISLENGVVKIEDFSPSPDYVTEFDQLYGRITDTSSLPEKTSNITFSSKIDRYVPVTIKGKAKLMTKIPNFNLTLKLKDMDLSSLTPYSSTYAGYEIDRGHMSLNLRYILKDYLLHGENRITINKFELGGKVDSDRAVNHPLKRPVAMLIDSKGRVDYNESIVENVNDPDFSIKGIFLKILKNLIKTAASPFKMPAGSIASGEDLGFIPFKHGSAELDKNAKKKLKKLSKGLENHPKLYINIKGKTDYTLDINKLKRKHLNKALKAASGIDTEAAGGVEKALLKPSWRNALFNMYYKTSGKTWQSARYIQKEKAKSKREVLNKKALLVRTIHYIYDYLSEKQPLTNGNLYILANARAKAVKSNLIEKNGIDSGQAFVITPDIDPSHTTSGVQLMLNSQ